MCQAIMGAKAMEFSKRPSTRPRTGLRSLLCALLMGLAFAIAIPSMGKADTAAPERIVQSTEADVRPIPVHPEMVSAEARAKGKLRRMLKGAGLDPEEIIPRVERRLPAVGGPFLPYPSDPKVASGIEEDAARRFDLVVKSVEDDPLIAAAAEKIPFAAPVVAEGRYSSGFGRRKDPINGRLAMHSGLDYSAPTGTAILATANGEVVEAGWRAGYGETVQIRHEFGLESVYAHLNQIRVEVGQRVQQGDRIGDMGSTGRSTGSHLHYEVRLNGAALNPMKFIEAGRDVYEEQDQRSDGKQH